MPAMPITPAAPAAIPTAPIPEQRRDDIDAACVTAAGLTRRVPRHDGARVAAVDDAPAEPAVRASRRTPQEIQSMLARYRSGLERGRTSDGGNREDEWEDQSWT